MKFKATIVIVLMFSLSAFGQTITLRGQIQNSKGTPIPNCVVKITGTDVAAVSDVCGQFAIGVEALDGLKFQIDMAGFEKWEVDAKAFEGQQRMILVLTDFPEMKNKYCKKKRKFGNTREIALRH